MFQIASAYITLNQPAALRSTGTLISGPSRKQVVPRLIIHAAKRPYRHVTERGEEVWICMCGLSETYPICSGRHRLVARERDDEVLMYDERGELIGPATGIQQEVLARLRRV